VLTSGGSGAAPTWTTVGGGSAATPTALGTVYGSQTTSGGTPFLTAYGYNAGRDNTGARNVFIGRDAGLSNVAGTDSIAIGYEALQDYSGADGVNIAIGSYALTSATTGSVYYNVAIGYESMKLNTSGYGNTAIGYRTLLNNTSGRFSTAIGYTALQALQTGNDGSTAVGAYAGSAITTGIYNVCVGGSSLSGVTTGSYNTAMGYNALGPAGTTSSSNTAFGYNALSASGVKSNNTAIGREALTANTTGDLNVAVGMNALVAQTTATQNTAMGYGAGAKLTTSGYNVAIGTSALGNMVNGANQNVAIGQNALLNYVNTSVSEGGAVAVGASALQNCTTGQSNIAMGRNAGLSVTTGANNVIIGNRAGESANCNYGVFLGDFCGIYTTGDYNTFIGWQAGHNTTSTTTGTQNTYIGAGARGSAVSNSFEIVIGPSATGKGSSTGFIAPSSGGVYQGNNSSSWSTTSDQRLKKNIVDNNIGLEKLNQIQVRNFEYRLPEEVDAELSPNDAIKKSGVQLGVIAQELQAVLPECVKTESTGVMSVDTDNLTWYLINAVKELSARIKQLEGN
jgi:hypothetical protein